MGAGWLFVLASLIAVVGIVISFKQLINHVGERLDNDEEVNQTNLQTEMTRFFMKVAFIEALPIVLIVLGFAQAENATNSSVPLTIVLLIFIFGIVNVFLSKSQLLIRKEIDSKTRNYFNTLTFIGISLVSAIPLISVVALLSQ